MAVPLVPVRVGVHEGYSRVAFNFAVAHRLPCDPAGPARRCPVHRQRDDRHGERRAAQRALHQRWRRSGGDCRGRGNRRARLAAWAISWSSMSWTAARQLRKAAPTPIDRSGRTTAGQTAAQRGAAGRVPGSSRRCAAGRTSTAAQAPEPPPSQPKAAAANAAARDLVQGRVGTARIRTAPGARRDRTARPGGGSAEYRRAGRIRVEAGLIVPGEPAGRARGVPARQRGADRVRPAPQHRPVAAARRSVVRRRHGADAADGDRDPSAARLDNGVVAVAHRGRMAHRGRAARAGTAADPGQCRRRSAGPAGGRSRAPW